MDSKIFPIKRGSKLRCVKVLSNSAIYQVTLSEAIFGTCISREYRYTTKSAYKRYNKKINKLSKKVDKYFDFMDNIIECAENMSDEELFKLKCMNIHNKINYN